MNEHRSAAWPLSAVAALLIVYASLHPLTGWTWPSSGQFTWWLPKQSREVPADMVANLLGYMPMGFILCVAFLRSGRGPLAAGWRTVLLCSVLSHAMELTQTLLPARVPSLSDWMLNSLGALWGAMIATVLQSTGMLDWWHGWRERLFIPQAGFGLSLLWLWPLGLLFPPPLPLGLGQLWPALHIQLVDWTSGTPLQAWLVPDDDLLALFDRPVWQAMSASGPWAGQPLPGWGVGHEALVVALGLLAPMTVACALARPQRVRVVLLAGAVTMAVGGSTVSSALNFGPDHALTWLSLPVLMGLTLGAMAGCLLLGRSRTTSAVLGLGVIALLGWLIHQVPTDPYYAQTLMAWEHGRFVRFHGLARWFGLLWPYLAFLWLLSRLTAGRQPA